MSLISAYLQKAESVVVLLVDVANSRVWTSEIVAAAWAEFDYVGVLLARLAVALKCHPHAEWRLEAELAFDDSDC